MAVATNATSASAGVVRSLIPARLDRLSWTPFHTRLVMALGVAWVLDGLEITIASSVTGMLSRSDTLGMSTTAVGAMATVYLVGQVVGALVFGRLSDRLGRRNLFMVTLAVYLVGSGLTALTLGHGTGWVIYLFATRFIAGAGIGGEYAAINSAIDEMIPARYRGRVDIAVNGTYWAGAIIGTLGALLFLNVLAPSVGWRLGFLLGPALAVVIVFVRRTLPESPRWLLMHGRAAEAERTMAAVEAQASSGLPQQALPSNKAIEIRPEPVGYRDLLRVLFVRHWRRSVLGATLMITQSFLYNAIFFTYVLVLTHFYGVNAASAPIYLLGFAAGNLLGPLTIGRLFDTIGRKPMIAGTYIGSGVLLAISAYLFDQGMLNAITQTVAWCVIFFFASAGASAAYLTVSEVFPLEVRAQAIAVFFAIAQCFGAIGPVLYGHLIGTGADPSRLFVGYLIGGAVMVVGGIVEVIFGVPAERKPLEAVALPLSAVHGAVPSSP
ncbi:MFS transporter [Virgisporangium aurantiacum]|uniref:MFS transporter n=1 Tax=Virgisporangium aurantiacum TaxID=175570 RepID=A0A8J3Z307_9ACTN|nr:MFS transporter [Virgisporangium aurantiacum]GIJ54351.1 MFS transporter [Virgisporangium aurantiacum]